MSPSAMLEVIYNHWCIISKNTSVHQPQELMERDNAISSPEDVFRDLNRNRFFMHYPNMWFVVDNILRQTGVEMTYKTCRMLIGGVMNLVCIQYDDGYMSSLWNHVLNIPGNARALQNMQFFLMDKLQWKLRPNTTPVYGSIEENVIDMEYTIWVREQAANLMAEFEFAMRQMN